MEQQSGGLADFSRPTGDEKEGDRMRITTRMVNDSATAAGVPVNSTTLLDYVKGGGSDNTSLVSMLAKGKNSTGKKVSGEKLAEAAESLEKAVDAIGGEGQKGLFETARAEENTDEIYKNVQTLLESYNSTLKALGSDSSALNAYYAQMLKEASTGNADALKKIGITVGKDGKLSVDQEKWKAADVDTLESVLGASSDWMGRLTFLSGKISDNAQAGLEGLGSRYNADGTVGSSWESSKYDLWG